MKKQSVWDNCSMLADKNTSATSFVLSIAEVRNSQCLVDSLVNAKPCVYLGCMGDFTPQSGQKTFGIETTQVENFTIEVRAY